MATNTPNYNLKKPSIDDYYDIADQNGNMDIIDTSLNTINKIAIGDNLIDNPDFKINQKGANQYNQNSRKAVDRWVLVYGTGTIDVVDKGIIVRWKEQTTSDIWTGIAQFMSASLYEYLKGKQVTVSGLLNDEIIKFTTIIPENPSANYSFGVKISDTMVFELRNWGVYFGLFIRMWGENDVLHAKWMKLELGDTATKFVYPHPAVELWKCQQYLQYRTRGDLDINSLRPMFAKWPQVLYSSPSVYMYTAEL